MTANRNQAFDFAKILAALGVVALHVPHANDLGKLVNQIAWPTCVPFFYVTALVFFLRKLPDEAPGITFSKQLHRLILPYLSWTFIYLALLHGKAWLVNKDRNFDPVGALLYGESAVHLYFLPTLFCYQLIAWSIFRISARRPIEIKTRLLSMMTLALGIGYLIVGDIQDRFGCGVPGNFIAAAMFIGFAFLWVFVKKVPAGATGIFVGTTIWLGSIALKISEIPLTVLGYPLILATGGLGFYVLVASLPWRWNFNWVRAGGLASFGIYLSHVILLEAYEFVVEKLLHTRVYHPFPINLFVIVMIFLGAWGCVILLRKFPYGRRFLLGEP